MLNDKFYKMWQSGKYLLKIVKSCYNTKLHKCDNPRIFLKKIKHNWRLSGLHEIFCFVYNQRE